MTTLLKSWKLASIFFGALFLILLINSKVPILPVTGLMFALSCILLWFTSMSAALFGLHKLMQCKEPISLEFLNRMIIRTKEVKPKNEALQLNIKNLKKLVIDIDKYFISKWYCNITSDESFTKESCIFMEESLSRLFNVQLQVNNKSLLLGISNIYLKHLKEFRRTLKRREKYGNVEIHELYRYAHLYSNSGTNKPKEYYILQLTTTLLRHFINSELWNSLPCHILIAVLAKKFTAYLLNMVSNPEFVNYVFLFCVAPTNVRDKLKLEEYGRIYLTHCSDVIETPKSCDNKEPKNKILDQSNKTENHIEYTCEVDGIQTDKDTKSRGPNELDSFIKTAEKNDQHTLKTELKTDVVLRRRKPLKKETLLPIEKHTKTDLKKIDPVKIYEPKSSTKTWRDTRDLACVSLGQDSLLEDLQLSPPLSASKIGAKFWEAGVRTEENKNQDSPTTNLFNEVVNMTSIEGLKSSIKPIISDATERTLHNIKDIQESTETTVHNALQKIEDFQVIEHADVENLRQLNKRELDSLKYNFYIPPHSLLHTSVMVSQVNTSSTTRQRRPLAESKDEAVGVVEGILDFGRAGFRKGLKLTGLQDNIENAKASITQAVSNTPKQKEKTTKQGKISNSAVASEQKMGSVESTKSVDSAKSVEESCWLNPMLGDSPNFDGQLLLEKQSSDESSKSIKLEDMLIPSISTEYAPSARNSPDPEYEDAADLASSIAKLRSLLQQRSSESSLSTPALSPMPDEYKQMESEATSDVEVDGVMPSFYKFCTKTASGVLSNTINTLKTALPSNSNEQAVNLNTWMFKADLKESDVLVRMKKLLTEREEYCTLDKEIDTAYEAIDSIDFCQSSPLISTLQFEDELDEFELKTPLTKTLVDIFCELLADTNSAFIQEPIVKAFLLILGNPIEKVLEQKIENFREYFAENLITVPEKSNTKSLSMEFNEYIDILFNSLPDTAKIILGKGPLKSALNLMASSLQTQKINQDIVLQVFELLAMKLIEESTTPPVSA